MPPRGLEQSFLNAKPGAIVKFALMLLGELKIIYTINRPAHQKLNWASDMD
jgi:hypothetical protein